MIEWMPIEDIPKIEGQKIVGYNEENDPKIAVFDYKISRYVYGGKDIWTPDVTHAIVIPPPPLIPKCATCKQTKNPIICYTIFTKEGMEDLYLCENCRCVFIKLTKKN